MVKYLRYVLRNIEPIRIADDSTSQSGETVSLRYIPGTAIRGLVINTLAKEEGFEQIKKKLFSNDIQYLNAYLMAGERELMPSPKGFYEDKTVVEGKKEIQNVVIKGEFSEGHKRASLGRYCYLDSDCIHYYNVDIGSDMKIKINVNANEKQNVFRSEYITPNHMFTGYIAVNDSSLKDTIKSIFKDVVLVGHGKSAGLGKCEVISCDYVDTIPFDMYLPKQEQENQCYMMLLSNTAMRNENGEICGFDLKQLAKKMNVENLEIEYCSTSTVHVNGYNRVWGVKTPSVVMYEQGSVFHFKFNGILKKENMLSICNEGIGVRKNEGFGRVLFLNNYEAIKYKQSETYEKVLLKANHLDAKQLEIKDTETLKIVAKEYYKNLLKNAMKQYVVKNQIQKGKIASSQLGTIDSLITAYKYNSKKALEGINHYFEHTLEKENNQKIQQERNSIGELQRFVNSILKNDLEELLSIKTKEKDAVMGISKTALLSKEEVDKLKLMLISDFIRYDNKNKEEVV